MCSELTSATCVMLSNWLDVSTTTYTCIIDAKILLNSGCVVIIHVGTCDFCIQTRDDKQAVTAGK